MGHVKCLETLFANGCHINLRDHLGYTPLMLACRQGQVEVAIYLINKLNDFNIRANNGDTMLHCIAMGGSIHLAKIILNILPTFLNKLNDHNESPLDICEMNEDDDDNDENSNVKNGDQGKNSLLNYLIEIGGQHGQSLLELSEYNDRRERNKQIEIRIDQDKRERDEYDAKNGIL